MFNLIYNLLFNAELFKVQSDEKQTSTAQVLFCLPDDHLNSQPPFLFILIFLTKEAVYK